MNGRERVLTALRRGEPDRVPILEIIIDPHVIEGIVPGGDLPAVVEKLDHDAICAKHAYAIQWIDDKLYKDEWGVICHTGPEITGHPVDGPIASAADLAHYTPPDPYAANRLGKLPEHVSRFKGERAIVWLQREAFMIPALLARLDRFLIMLHDDPGLVRRLVDMVVEVNEALARRAVRAGADVVCLADDYAWRTGPLMSPAQFREFFLPGIARVVQAVHEEGALCFKHSDGNMWPLMDYLVEAGFDGVNPLEPLAGMDLGEVKRRYGDKVCLLGNVDCGYTLSEAPVSEVVAEVKRCLRDGAPGGGYILTSSNSLHSSVRPQNYIAMVDTARRHGRYPLDMKALE